MWGYSDVLWWLLINCVGHWQDVTKCDKMCQNVTKIEGPGPWTVTKRHKVVTDNVTNRQKLA